MSQHTIAEARERLIEIIDRALAGESVVITRDGRPVVEIRPLAEDRPTSAGDVAWLRRHRVGRIVPGAPDAGELVSQMRDEDWR